MASVATVLDQLGQFVGEGLDTSAALASMVLGGIDCNLVGEGERLGRYRVGEGRSTDMLVARPDGSSPP